MKIIFWLATIAILVGAGCKGKGSGSSEKKADSMVQIPGPMPGKIAIMQAFMDPSQQYGCYLPKGYDSLKRYPVIYWFDSKAMGTLPLEKYQGMADELGLIMVGSLNSKNGLKPMEYAMITGILVEDVLQRFNIDSTKMYSAGFSGGARVAGNLAYEDKRFKGVLYNGAGPDPEAPAHVQRLSMVCIGGWSDFNLAEMQENLKKVNCLRKQFLVFEGGHVWATEDKVSEGMRFLMDANQGNQPTYPLSDVILKKERQTQNAFREAMAKEGVEYWKIKILELGKLRQNSNTQHQYLIDRQLGYLSIMAYSFSTRALSYEQPELAEHFCAVYQAVDSTNSEWAYLTACAKMLANKSEDALASLATAKRLGFTDKNRMMKEPLFQALFPQKGFQELLK